MVYREPFQFAVMCLVLMGCGEGTDPSQPNSRFVSAQTGAAANDPYGGYSANEIRFLDDVASNTDLNDVLLSSRFVGLDGAEQTATEIAPGSHLVLVILRGYTDPICPACTRQTAQLIASHAEFAERGAEVAVVYPVEESSQQTHWEDLLSAARSQLEVSNNEVPFTLMFDVGLATITDLGLRDQLSKPATYIVDRNGQVVFAYEGVGGTELQQISDRPSIANMLRQLDQLNADVPATESPPTTEADS